MSPLVVGGRGGGRGVRKKVGDNALQIPRLKGCSIGYQKTARSRHRGTNKEKLPKP